MASSSSTKGIHWQLHSRSPLCFIYRKVLFVAVFPSSEAQRERIDTSRTTVKLGFSLEEFHPSSSCQAISSALLAVPAPGAAQSKATHTLQHHSSRHPPYHSYPTQPFQSTKFLLLQLFPGKNHAWNEEETDGEKQVLPNPTEGHSRSCTLTENECRKEDSGENYSLIVTSVALISITSCRSYEWIRAHPNKPLNIPTRLCHTAKVRFSRGVLHPCSYCKS